MRKKAPAPEPKPVFDLNSALPPSDDFRTSLLMPKLSARFSMLKEQDDPTSKIGKANDDSVLFPKRASRLDLFNSRQGLTDIAEDDPLRGSVRPPYALDRTESYGSEGYVTDEGSMMGRAKPGEGNTMFGGRQKIYKIPVGGAGSVKHFGAADDLEVPIGANMGGKPIYESDTTQSTFQKLRQREREEKERAALESGVLRSSREQDRSGSPPYPRYNRDRETSSSTTSAPSQSRSSTAATSVASQRSIYNAHDNVNGYAGGPAPSQLPGPDRTFIKPRRLYGQGSDRDQAEPHHTLQRMGSYSRTRTPGVGLAGNPLRQSRSATNLGDRFHRGGPLHNTHGFRPESPAFAPSPSRLAEFDLGLDEESCGTKMVDSGYGRSPPVSPPMSPDLQPHNPDPTLVAATEPDDLGKATASGAFNKPRKQYDEQQYLQRQLQLQDERNTPSPQFSRPFSPALPSMHDQASVGRSRNNSQGSNFSRTNSIRRPWIEDRVPRALPKGRLTPTSRTRSDSRNQPHEPQDFLADKDTSSGESSPVIERRPSEQDSDRESVVAQQYESTNVMEDTEPIIPIQDTSHLPEPSDDSASESRSYRSERTITQSQVPSFLQEPQGPMIDADSPTLGPVGNETKNEVMTNGLSGMVRAHLRTDSGQSSVYPDESPRRSRRSEAHASILGHGAALEEQIEHEIDVRGGNHPPPAVTSSLFDNARSILEQAKSHRNLESSKVKQTLGKDKVQQILGGDAPRTKNDMKAAPLDQARSYHNRGASTETQKEREELAMELAERRRIVQDKLQTFVESESRSASPAPLSRARAESPGQSGNGLGLLKKSSRGSLVGREKSSKAMKMLGLDHDPPSNQPPPSLFMMPEQLPDRAMPPRSKAGMPFKPRREVSAGLGEALGMKQRQKIHPEARDRNQRMHSRTSSKSSSAYSGGSDVPVAEPTTAQPSASLNGQRNGHLDSGRPSIDDHNPGGPLRQDGNVVVAPELATGGRLRSNSRPGDVEMMGKRTAPPGTPYMINPSNRPNPPGFSKSAPALREKQMYDSSSHPTLASPRFSPTRHIQRAGQGRKYSINKQDISEPTFISCTSSVDTVDLPPGASLKNGMDSLPSSNVPPPIPARDSRRKRTMTLRQAFGRSDKSEQASPLPSPSRMQGKYHDPHEERSTFSDDEPTQKPKQRLRKIQREDGHSFKLRQAQQSPASQGTFSQPTSPIGDHIPFQARQDVPASAVMF